MTDEESLSLNSGDEFRYIGKTLVFLPGSFKPPHKGHWEMVTDNIDIADEIHIFISNMSNKTVLNNSISKSKFSKMRSFLSKNKSDANGANELILDILNSYATLPYKDIKQKIKTLIELTKDDAIFNEKLTSLFDSLDEDAFVDVRRLPNGTSIDAETSEKIFNIFAKEYGIYDKVITHICNNPMPIRSAIGFGNHQCKNCDIYIGSTTNDEAADRDAGWNGIITQFKYNPTNRIHRLPEATKIQAARDIRKNINNLTKDMFPPKISDTAFNEIKRLLNPNIQESRKFVSKFNILFESVMRSLVLESGIAIKNIQPIQKANIQPTLDKFYDEILKPLKINTTALSTVGSTGKKDVSGDLDVALDLNDALASSGLKDEYELAGKIGEICNAHNYQFSNALNSRFKTIHVGFPIVNQDGIAQIDMMPTRSMQYTKFKLNAPGKDESKYKGVHRSALLMSLIKICSVLPDENASAEDLVEYTDKKGIKYPSIQFSQFSLEPEGLVKTVKTFRGKRGNLVSEPRVISKETTNYSVSDILNKFFKNLYNESDFNSFETIWNNVIFSQNFPYKDKINDIVNDFVSRFTGNMSWQLDDHKESLPKEVEEYLK